MKKIKEIKPRIPTLVPPNKIMKSKKDYDRKKLKLNIKNFNRTSDRPFFYFTLVADYVFTFFSNSQIFILYYF